MYTFRSGETRCGEWDDGNLKIPLSPLTDAVLRAVQVTKNPIPPSKQDSLQYFSTYIELALLVLCRQPGRLQKMQSTFAGLTSKSTRLWWRQIGLPLRPELLLSKLFRIGSMENFATLTCEINKHYITGKCKFTTEFPYEKYRTCSPWLRLKASQWLRRVC